MRDPGVARGLKVAEVSSLLGVPVPTLRAWERRYGWPAPERTEGGHRRYTPAEVDRLVALRNEIARGRTAASAVELLQGLYDKRAATFVDRLVGSADSLDVAEANRALDDAGREMSPGEVALRVALPALREIGDHWEFGRCDVAGEHLATGAIRRWLRRQTELVAPEPGDPQILLACGPDDTHSGGIEAFALLLAERSCHPVITGPRTPSGSATRVAVHIGAAAVVVVSHMATNRSEAVETLRALVASTDAIVYYSGNAFSPARSRRGVPGRYLGWDLEAAADRVADEVRSRG